MVAELLEAFREKLDALVQKASHIADFAEVFCERLVAVGDFGELQNGHDFRRTGDEHVCGVGVGDKRFVLLDNEAVRALDGHEHNLEPAGDIGQIVVFFSEFVKMFAHRFFEFRQRRAFCGGVGRGA